MSSHRAKEEVS
jgi:hypothetical protein